MIPGPALRKECPGCGKYYFLADAKTLPPGEDRWRSLYELFSNGEIDDSDI